MINELRLKRLTDGTFYISYYSFPAMGEVEYSFPNSVEMFTFLVKEFLDCRTLGDFRHFVDSLEEYESSNCQKKE